MDVVLEELCNAGLEVNAGKTTAWTRDPSVPLSRRLQLLRKASFRCLGAAAPWMDAEDPLSRLPAHELADGDAAVREAGRFRDRLAQLAAAGLSHKTAFQLLQTYSAGCVTHLLRANYEDDDWVQRLDEIWLSIVSDLAGDALDDSQKKQAFLRLPDGGLGITSAADTASLAYLASWALTLREVSATLGVSSWSAFLERCEPLGARIAQAEAAFRQRAGGEFEAADWVSCLAEPRGKLQGVWGHRLKAKQKRDLLQQLPLDDKVDLRSSGGPGAGGFLEPPIRKEGGDPKQMPTSTSKSPSETGCV